MPRRSRAHLRPPLARALAAVALLLACARGPAGAASLPAPETPRSSRFT